MRKNLARIFQNIKNIDLRKSCQSYKAFCLNREKTGFNRQFLPAVVELQETPASPTARYFLWGVCVFIVLTLCWAIFGKIDIVARGEGKIISFGRAKIIQPLETGKVREILIQEGDRVSKGEILVKLDMTFTDADEKKLQQDLLYAVAVIARLEALRDKTELQYKADMPENIQRMNHNLFTEALKQHRADVEALEQQKNKKEFELKSVQATRERLRRTIPLITERAQNLKALALENIVSRSQALSVEEQRLSQVYEHQSLTQKSSEISAEIQSIAEQLKSQESAFMQKILAELEVKNQERSRLEQDLAKAKERNLQQHLIAPISGTVQELKIHTTGGVVTPAQELMKIIPQDEKLLAEIFMPNKDIGFIHVGQSVRLKLEAFPFTKYGFIEGEIENISLDAIQTEQQGLLYAVQVAFDQTHFNIKGTLIALTPGMSLTGEIKTGTRRIVEYFLSPIAFYKSEAIRER